MMVRITSLKLTCPDVPVQWEGKLSNGWEVYARSRFSHVSVCVWNPETNNMMEPNFMLTGNISLASEYDTCRPHQLKMMVDRYITMLVFPE